eukprot:GHVU01029895.1.p1 GENE.GHVU01029895.1~~GHVU01029895.1.p1  ORF type:complete len:107 (-),score=0.34 GHVU01029895.1:371-652(-)
MTQEDRLRLHCHHHYHHPVLSESHFIQSLHAALAIAPETQFASTRFQVPEPRAPRLSPGWDSQSHSLTHSPPYRYALVLCALYAIATPPAVGK